MYEGSDSRYGSLHEEIAEDLKDSQYMCQLFSYYLVIYSNALINGLTYSYSN